MKYEIRWTVKSTESFEEVIDYLRQNWSEQAVDHFVKEVFSTIQLISEFPLMFKSIKRKEVRKALINKHVSLYYQINNQSVELLVFWPHSRNEV